MICSLSSSIPILRCAAAVAVRRGDSRILRPTEAAATVLRHVSSSHQKNDSSLSSTSKNNDKEESFLKVYHLQGVTMKESKNGVRAQTGFHNIYHTISTDLPKSMGGHDLAPQPVELLLASWMGCTQATALFVARHMMTTTTNGSRHWLERMEFVNITAYRDERGALELPVKPGQPPSVPSRLIKIQGTIRVYRKGGKNALISDEDMKLLREQTEWRCPVANMMIASGCDLEGVQWVDGNAYQAKLEETDD